MSVRCGIGYDLHRLAEGRKLTVGGIEVPFEKGPVGHSDGVRDSEQPVRLVRSL